MNIDMIEAARKRLKGYSRVTPLLSSPFIDELAGRRVFVKAETLQHKIFTLACIRTLFQGPCNNRPPY